MQNAPESETNEQGLSARRSFLKWLIGALSAMIGLITGIPFIRAVISSAPLQQLSYVEVGNTDSLPVGQPQDMNFRVTVTDVYVRQEVTRSVWVIKHSSADLTVFSPICTHLGCHYKWNAQTRHFECPCHASVFAIDGRVMAGPAPRPLDTLRYKIIGGKLYVEWQHFKVGVAGKVRV